MTRRGPKPTTGRSPGMGGKELRVWVSAEEHARCVEAARVAGLTLGDWMLARLLATT